MYSPLISYFSRKIFHNLIFRILNIIMSQQHFMPHKQQGTAGKNWNGKLRKWTILKLSLALTWLFSSRLWKVIMRSRPWSESRMRRRSSWPVRWWVANWRYGAHTARWRSRENVTYCWNKYTIQQGYWLSKIWVRAERAPRSRGVNNFR